MCDDGNTDNNDGCSSTCIVEDGYSCSRTGSTSSTPDTCTSLCGNGALEAVNAYVEACDDGNLVNNDGCTNCVIDDSHTCSRNDNSASHPDTCFHRCGNGQLETVSSYSETCDDANQIDNDGCTSCVIDDSHTCSRTDNTAANPDNCVHNCGNGVLDSLNTYTEECDDSNTLSNDGCSSSCSVEDPYTC